MACAFPGAPLTASISLFSQNVVAAALPARTTTEKSRWSHEHKSVRLRLYNDIEPPSLSALLRGSVLFAARPSVRA